MPVTPKGDSALSWAVWYGRAEAARELLGAGAKPNLATAKGETPLMFAAFRDQPDIVELLLEVCSLANKAALLLLLLLFPWNPKKSPPHGFQPSLHWFAFARFFFSCCTFLARPHDFVFILSCPRLITCILGVCRGGASGCASSFVITIISMYTNGPSAARIRVW